MAVTLRSRNTDWHKHALAKGLVSEQDLRDAESQAKTSGAEVADILLRSGKLTEELLAKLKAEAAGLVYMDVLDYRVDAKALALVSEQVARKHTVLPLYRVGTSLTVAMADPWNTVALDEVRLNAKVPIVRPVLGTASAIRKSIERHYGHRVVEQAAKQSTTGTATGPAPAASRVTSMSATTGATDAASDVSVAKLVDTLFSQALEARASDIHLEPDDAQLRVRFRVDGVLQEIKQLPMAWHEGLTSRIKLLAKLDITEHRLPQDGHLPLTIEGRPIDLRISTYPTVFGENVVVRLLDHSSLALNLETLGFAPDVLPQLLGLIQRPHGMLLVTGPTGSGKTTTLYAAMSHINSITKNIVTIEDPVEYRLPLIRQTQVNVKAGVTFATGLRSLLRQDPDVMMVGEIRDHETAEIAIHAALTGHLVLSTLHTNDAVSAAARLLDMGVEPYLLSSTLLGVVAQRLVRRLCANCKAPQELDAPLRARYPQLTALYHARGCHACQQGYVGRMGVFELFRITEATQHLIAQRQSSSELKAQAMKEGMQTMRGDGLRKVQEGFTTLDELDRVVPVEAGNAS